MEVNSLYTSFAVTAPVPTAPASALAGSVATLLPAGSQSVAPVGSTAAPGYSDPRSTPGGQQGSADDTPGQTQTIGKFTRDAATNSLVFMEIDPQTEAVIVQFPDEQLLKLRSYVAEMQRREEAAQQSIPGSHITKTT